jgi:hypothetical protein
VTLGERACRREDAGQIGKAADHDRQHGHELATLLGHIALEQRLDRGGDLEQPIVENLCRLVGDRRDLAECLLNERHLFWSHGTNPAAFAMPPR